MTCRCIRCIHERVDGSGDPCDGCIELAIDLFEPVDPSAETSSPEDSHDYLIETVEGLWNVLNQLVGSKPELYGLFNNATNALVRLKKERS